MYEAFLIVAIVLFVLSAAAAWGGWPHHPSLVPIGLAFFAAAFLVAGVAVTTAP